MLPPREVVPMDIISTSRVSHGSTATSWHRSDFLAAGSVSSIAPTGRDVKSRVSCDRGRVEMAAYKGKCGAHSCRPMERMD